MLPRLKRRRRWGKDGDERRITKKSGSAQRLPSPAHPSAPPRLRSVPLAQGSASRSCPLAPAEPLPAATGQRKSPAARPDPARRRRATLPAPGAPGAAPGPLARRSPTTTIISPPAPGPRCHFTPRDVPRTAGREPTPRREPDPHPGPGDNEQPQLTSSAGASWVRGRFLCPFSFPFSSA